ACASLGHSRPTATAPQVFRVARRVPGRRGGGKRRGAVTTPCRTPTGGRRRATIPHRSPPMTTPPRLRVESLGNRLTPPAAPTPAATATVSQTSLVVYGTDAADSIRVDEFTDLAFNPFTHRLTSVPSLRVSVYVPGTTTISGGFTIGTWTQLATFPKAGLTQ